MDTWTDRLSEYVDGELDATSVASLEQHLRVCEECSAIVADLRFIAASAAALEPLDPTVDLWPGIAAQIGAADAAGARGDADVALKVVSLDAHRAKRRGITLSMPQLAAAAIVLLALGGAIMWQLKPNAGSNGAVATTQQPNAMRNVSTGDLRGNAVGDPVPNQGGYDAAIEQLEQAAAQNEAQLDPKTTKVIEQSMATIDRAIADARAALAADPANAYLHRHLDRTMKQKLDLLRQASKIDRGGA